MFYYIAVFCVVCFSGFTFVL